MKHRPTPTTAIACVALFFSLTGAGIAATGYRITSIWQLSPSVRHALRGSRGPTGAAGVAGPQGPQGPHGQTGASAADLDPYRVSVNSALTSASPTVQVIATCQGNDREVQGGFQGSNEIVTDDIQYVGFNSLPGDSIIDATLNPADTSGSITAWALCVPAG